MELVHLETKLLIKLNKLFQLLSWILIPRILFHFLKVKFVFSLNNLLIINTSIIFKSRYDYLGLFLMMVALMPRSKSCGWDFALRFDTLMNVFIKKSIKLKNNIVCSSFMKRRVLYNGTLELYSYVVLIDALLINTFYFCF